MSRGPNWSKTIACQDARRDRVLAKVTETRDAPRLTVERLRELVEAAKLAGEETIEITVLRHKAPPARKPIRLILASGERLLNGPMSSDDHDVTHAGGHNWRARWRVADCEIWLRRTERRQ